MTKTFEGNNPKSGLLERSCYRRLMIFCKPSVLLGVLLILIFVTVAINVTAIKEYGMKKYYLVSADPDTGIVSRTTTYLTSRPKCRMETCFDYSKCPLFGGFPVYVYKVGQNFSSENLNEFVKWSVSRAFSQSPYISEQPGKACVYITLIGEPHTKTTADALQKTIDSLEHWKKDGRNHILLHITRTPTHIDVFKNVNTGKAIIIQSAFTDTEFRRDFDVVIPPSLGNADGQVWSELPPLSPIRRKFFLSFSGHCNSHGNTITTEFSKLNNSSEIPSNYQGEKALAQESQIMEGLKKIQSQQKGKVNITLLCKEKQEGGIIGEWSLCRTASDRKKLLRQSTFNIIISPVNHHVTSTTVFQTRLYEALKHGTIPVMIGDVLLPYSELLDWTKAVIFIPRARVSELYSMLATFSDNDLADYKWHGRMFWESFFGTTRSIIATVLSVLRSRLQIPAKAIKDEPSSSAINKFIPVPPRNQTGKEEVLGPVEPPFPSIQFIQNFTTQTLRDVFNKPGDPFHLFPHSPFVKVLPSDAKFKGSGNAFQHINKGLGGAGKAFSAALGGNYPKEQFTVVMQTYKRVEILLKTINGLMGLPFLNKVLVIWNSPDPPKEDMGWPDIGVPVVVIKAKKNSLNNRFLPYDSIETEAVFSMDDDSALRHDEIVLAFRVWREERDRIVGIPGRYHGWDESRKRWNYMIKPACEVSLVLTGAAFFHKYYSYIYTYTMPKAIRDKVDEYMNCEDIAINFLVSHITRKPPLKVAAKWHFACYACSSPGLSGDSSHYKERDKCVNYFSEVYGYTPLLYSQYRADSVLYDTHLPEKELCFRKV